MHVVADKDHGISISLCNTLCHFQHLTVRHSNKDHIIMSVADCINDLGMIRCHSTAKIMVKDQSFLCQSLFSVATRQKLHILSIVTQCMT